MNVLGRLPEVGSTLTRALIVPSSNMKVAVALYATIAVFLLLVLVVGLLLIMSGPDKDGGEAVPSAPRRVVRAERVTSGQASRAPAWPLAVAMLAVLLAVWIAAGFTTSSSQVCKSCHWPAAEHAKAGKIPNPHARVDCVSCHESGGPVGRYATGVPIRLLHLATTYLGGHNSPEYGQATSSACIGCHERSVATTLTDSTRGLRMSHAEPIEASARCTFCHTMRHGVIGAHNVGMRPCLRCHDGRRAASECGTCHQKETGTAVRVRATSFRAARISDVSCGGCHDEKRECDPCHGLRMPHTTAFKRIGHARAAATDVWDNNGKACRRCHTENRHPCAKCHTTMMGRAHGPWLAEGHKDADRDACDTCHRKYAYPVTRDFCKDVCHGSASGAAQPR